VRWPPPTPGGTPLNSPWDLLAGLPLLFVIVVLVGRAIAARRRSSQESSALTTMLEVVPERLGMEVTGRTDWSLEGRLDGVKLCLEHRTRDDRPEVELGVGDYGQIPVSLYLLPKGRLHGGLDLPRRPLRTGDEAFDRQVTLEGERRDVALALTPRARERVRHVVGELHCWVSSSSVYWRVADAHLDLDELLARIPVMVDLIRALTPTGSTHAHLASLLPDETCPDMAGLLAEQLFTHCVTGRKSAQAAAALVDHPSGRARLFAALRLHPEGSGWLASIADDRADERVFRMALEFASHRLDPALVAEAALDALRLEDTPLQLEACKLLFRHGPKEAIGPLHRLVEQRRRPRELRDAARQAMESVRARHPHDSAGGGLELASQDPRDGALELAEGPADGGLELVD
jgi:hypothetical protein